MLVQSQIQAQNPPPPMAPQEPKAVLTGPEKADPGELIKISAAGTFGQDPKIECVPGNKGWAAGRALYDDTITITFSTREQGTYYFVLAVNFNNKTSFTIHQITVGQPQPGPGPTPIPTPDTLAQKLKGAFLADGGNVDQKTKLIALMTEMSKETTGTYGTLANTLKNASTQYLQGALPNTRSAITEYILTIFPKTANTPIDATIVKKTFEDVATALKSF